MQNVGVVVIGRNEGERLVRCLRAIPRDVGGSVYVDSASTDDSVDQARQRGADVVELDMRLPFTAARARNEGFRRLLASNPDLEFVQFVDGDCELRPGWLAAGLAEFAEQPQAAIVVGSRHERHPGQSIYNLLCDVEWQIPVGDALYCGGDSLMRVSALQQVHGFRDSLIAGEEPELCVRLRARGWKIRSIAPPMSVHEANILRFGQWWRRTVRTGFAYAEGAALHGRGPSRHWVRESRSIWFWGLLVPLMALLGAWPTMGLSLLLLGGYPVLFARIYRHMRRRKFVPSTAWRYAFFTVLGKFAHARGQLQYVWNRWRGRPTAIIEYKAPAWSQAANGA